VPAESLKPIVFGSLVTEVPEWLRGLEMLNFAVDNSAMLLPLSVALQLSPELELVSIKDASPEAPETTLRAKLIHEAMARRARLKEMYKATESLPSYDLIKSPLAPDPEALLLAPMEVFMIGFEENST
ncbi:unnamed protein product, partial [Effrenium voratum]